jgi:hypothetical protein
MPQVLETLKTALPRQVAKVGAQRVAAVRRRWDPAAGERGRWAERTG